MPRKAKEPVKEIITLDTLFRYLEKKYLGKYRVLARYELDTEDFPRNASGGIEESFDEQYIPCSKGEIRASSSIKDGEAVLVWYVNSIGKGHNVLAELQEKYKNLDIEVDEVGSFDYLIYFKESDLPKVASVVKPRTNGAKIPPYSVKNLPKEVYEIPEKDVAALEKALGNLTKVQKMQYLKKWYSEFDEVIRAKKGKKFDLDYEKKITKLGTRDFIHSIGMWNELVKYIKEKVKDI